MIKDLLVALAPGMYKPDMVPHPDGDGMLVTVRKTYETQRHIGPRGNQRKHVLTDVASFAAYLSRIAPDGTGVDIALDPTPGNRKVVANLVPTNPEGDTVELRLALHPTLDAFYAAWTNKGLTQAQMVELIRAYGADAQIENVNAVLGELRKFKMTKGSERQVEINELGLYAFRTTTQSKKIEGMIPTELELVVPVFQGILGAGADGKFPTSFEIPLSLQLDDDDEAKDEDPVFTLRCAKWPLIYAAAVDHAAGYIRSLLPNTYLVTIGALHFAPVPLRTK